jgi:two-component system chemotaxis response regulator CheB
MTRYTRDLVVVGASAGGVEALREFAAGLPGDLAASVLVVLHLPAGGTSALPAILSRSGPLPARSARTGMPMEHGVIYVAPPNHHLIVLDGQVALSHGPTENGRRPAINALFRSAAVTAGPRVTGVLLSGVLDDGVAGLVSIASRGGRTIAQDPAEALYPGMPRHAMQSLAVDHVLPAGAVRGPRQAQQGGSGSARRSGTVQADALGERDRHLGHVRTDRSRPGGVGAHVRLHLSRL